MQSTAIQSALGSHQAEVFEALDDYSLLAILEQLEFGDLAVSASLSARTRQLAVDFKLIPVDEMKNASLHIAIYDDVPKIGVISADGNLRYVKELCKGQNHVVATLAAFCPMFSHLTLNVNNYYQSYNDTEQTVIDCVNRYCSTVSQKLLIRNFRYSFAEFTAPNVSSAVIEFPEMLKNFSFRRQCPQVKELTIAINDYYVIKEHLPHLTHFELTERNACGNFDLRTFGALNPQIRSVRLDLCQGLHNLQQVNEMFPSLVSLYYKPKHSSIVQREQRMQPFPVPYENHVESVRFRNVRRYTIDLSDYYHQRQDGGFQYFTFTKLSAVRFDQLETLVYVTEWDMFNNVKFIEQYKEVAILEHSSKCISYDELWQLVELLPNLKKITVRLAVASNRTDHEDLLRLMRDTNLESICAWVDASEKEEYCRMNLPAR